jgi:sortase A
MSFTTVRLTVGRVVLVAGVLVLLFIPYLLWGTGLMTARSQATLRSQFSEAQKKTGTVIPRVHLRPDTAASRLLEVAPPASPPPLGGPVGNISIPKIGLSMMVVEGTGESQLEMGPGHYPGTPLPGEQGNVAIAGHRTTYLHPFYSLDALVPGDAINVITLQGIFLYHVMSSQAVSPDDVAVVAPTHTPELTLTTCNPRYSASQRLVVQATLVASILVDAKHPAAPAPSRRTTHSSNSATLAGAVGNSGPQKDWGAAIGWGVLVAGLTISLWIVAARTRHWRAAVIGLGVLTWLVLVFFFFQSVAPLLPASY